MTDRQIVDFILFRAKKSVAQAKSDLVDPKLVLYHNAQRLYLAVKFKNYNEPCMIRFIRKNNMCGLFQVKCDNPEFSSWKQALKNSFGNTAVFIADYDLESLPPYIKHFVSYAFIEALKSKGIGFDMFALSYPADFPLIDPNETYEEVSIETDLMGFEIGI